MAMVVACGGNSPAGSGGGDADIQATAGLQFLPGQLTISAGSSVTFGFGAVVHTVVFDPVAGRPADIGATSGAEVARLFASPGSFPYHCTIHPQMSGTVVVGSASTPPPPPPLPPPPPPPPGYLRGG
jgi:plastocyanin